MVETASFEELSLLAVGFQGLKDAPVAAVVGGAPGAAMDDADPPPDEIVMLPPPANPGRLACWKVRVPLLHMANTAAPSCCGGVFLISSLTTRALSRSRFALGRW